MPVIGGEREGKLIITDELWIRVGPVFPTLTVSAGPASPNVAAPVVTSVGTY